jgi:hypothetical protein
MRDEENLMIKRSYLFATVLTLLLVAGASAQHPILDMLAGKVVQKYQQSTCEQLWEQRGKPKPQREQEMIQMLKGDPQLRTEFINKVAGPVANKMFECGLIP